MVFLHTNNKHTEEEIGETIISAIPVMMVVLVEVAAAAVAAAREMAQQLRAVSVPRTHVATHNCLFQAVTLFLSVPSQVPGIHMMLLYACK